MHGGGDSRRKPQIGLFDGLKVTICSQKAGAKGLGDMLSTGNDMADGGPLYLD